MRLKHLYLLVCVLLLSLHGFSQQVSFTMEAPKVVELGEQFRLAFTINAKGQNLKLPELTDFDILMGPSTSQSSSFQIVNGVSSQSVSFSYLFVLKAKKDGRFTVMMPHAERVFRSVQQSWHPAAWGEDSPWMRMFRNARKWVG